MKNLSEMIINFCYNNFENIKITNNHLYCNSPFVDDESQKFVINLEKGFWKCFKTNTSGSDFFKLLNKLKEEEIEFSWEFLEKNESLQKKVEFKNDIAKIIIEDTQRYDILKNLNLENVNLLYRKLKERKVSDRKIKQYRLYYIEDRNISYMFVSLFNKKDELIGCQLWDYTKKTKTKYKTYVLKNDEFIFGLNVVKQKNKKVLGITEGIFDAMQIEGITKLGATLTENQMNYLYNDYEDLMKNIEMVILFEDNDEVGLKSLKRDYFNLINYFPFLSDKIYFYAWESNLYKDINEQGRIEKKWIKKFDEINYITFMNKHNI